MSHEAHASTSLADALRKAHVRGKPKIAYFAHDVFEPAVQRRVRMLELGGAHVVVVGFRRGPEELTRISNAAVFDLGQTFDARLAHRAAAVASALAKRGAIRKLIVECDALLARNLEMLTIARAVRRDERQRLVYECLDIHRSMLSGSLRARTLRAIERRMLRDTDLVIVSSPAFVQHYFRPVQGRSEDVLLVENKVLLEPDGPPSSPRAPLPPGPPWRIGWFGVLRCQRSFEMLAALAKTHPGLVEVDLRGRSAQGQFEDFEGLVAATPGFRYFGAYEAKDLSDMYGQVHFAWGVDYFDVGANSDWLLPNRLYESLAFGVPVIARPETQAGAWLRSRGLEGPCAIDDLVGFFKHVNRKTYGAFLSSAAQLGRGDVMFNARDGQALLAAIMRVRDPIAGTVPPLTRDRRADDQIGMQSPQRSDGWIE